MRRDGEIIETGYGLDRMIADLRAMEREDGSLRERLDRVTGAFCEGLRAAMPVRTGRLKSSGYWTSHMDGDVYEADVTFGGVVAPYAPYVVGRGIDGEHAWDAVLPRFEPLFEDVINAEFRD
jgi:hypothetical protein